MPIKPPYSGRFLPCQQRPRIIRVKDAVRDVRAGLADRREHLVRHPATKPLRFRLDHASEMLVRVGRYRPAVRDWKITSYRPDSLTMDVWYRLPSFASTLLVVRSCWSRRVFTRAPLSNSRTSHTSLSTNQECPLPSATDAKALCFRPGAGNGPHARQRQPLAGAPRERCDLHKQSMAGILFRSDHTSVVPKSRWSRRVFDRQHSECPEQRARLKTRTGRACCLQNRRDSSQEPSRHQRYPLNRASSERYARRGERLELRCAPGQRVAPHAAKVTRGALG